MSLSQSAQTLPPSATHPVVAGMGVLAFFAAILIIRQKVLPLDIAQSSLFIMAVTAFVLFASDLLMRRFSDKDGSQAEQYIGPLVWARIGVKLVGLIGTLALIAFFYWLFPEYHGSFYYSYYEMLFLIAPVVVVLAVPYMVITDRRMQEPLDGYWHMGKLLMLRARDVSWPLLVQHLLGWTIKAFFLPLMFVYLCSSLDVFLHVSFDSLTDFKSWYDFLYGFCYFLDVALCSVGYLFALRLMGTHIRSAEPTMQGWIVAIICYQPIYSMMQNQYLGTGADYFWGDWLGHNPLLYTVWGSAVLLLTAIYVWATVAFGARFSNLTHRGIITSGPYRYTKHPAYIAKNLSWWMISIPFLATDNVMENIRQCVLLLLLNIVYWLRAKTEERHLICDPVYVAYREAIRARGIFRFLERPKQWIIRIVR